MLSKARVLSDIDVTFISLVDKGANQKTIIWKAAGESAEPAFKRTIDVVKTDADKRLVYGIVYAPDEWDAHEDTASASEIEKAAHLFMKAARTQKVDKQHDLSADEGYVAESWIVREGDSLFKEVGAWAVAIKVENDETWDMVKSGEIAGISLYGTASYEEVQKSDPNKDVTNMDKNNEQQPAGPLARLTKWVTEKAAGLKKDFASNLQHNQIGAAVNALWYALDDITYSSHRDKLSALIEEAQSFIQHIESLKPMQKSEESNPKPGTDQASGLEARIDSLAKSVEQLTGVVEGLVKSEKPAEEPAQKTEETPVQKSEASAEDDKVADLKARIEELEKASAGRQSAQKRHSEPEEEKAVGIPLF